jgi:hypothetical protein
MLKKLGFIILVIFALIGFGFVSIYFAVKFGFTNTSGIIDEQRDYFINQAATSTQSIQEVEPKEQAQFKAWSKTYEWSIVKSALLKDVPVITKAANDSGVSPRIIVSQLVVEQLRLFFSERQAFKKWFEPLKILGSQTQFSWGVMGMKEDTAIQVEQHLTDKTSPYYLGESYEHVLDFKTTDIEQERFTRMTDQHNHYYSYLYAGLFIKQIMTQWKNAGFDISDSPEIISTIYNLGFSKSIPKPYPQSGGAQITIDGIKYSFGSLGADFYNSDELKEEFSK